MPSVWNSYQPETSSIWPGSLSEEFLGADLERKEALVQNNASSSEGTTAGETFGGIIGLSLPLKRMLDQVMTVAPTDSTVLIEGETGTGKELVARAIHNLSTRRNRNFVKFNCAAIPLGLLESELFGHEKGAFAGAIVRKIGRVELADQGTLFLDEIGDIPLELQAKLLRVLQEQEFERLGSTPYTTRECTTSRGDQLRSKANGGKEPISLRSLFPS
jgi:transcriptional regulator with GAF, ATPase, and Fis domain